MSKQNTNYQLGLENMGGGKICCSLVSKQNTNHQVGLVNMGGGYLSAAGLEIKEKMFVDYMRGRFLKHF